jgi:hypothetical protein
MFDREQVRNVVVEIEINGKCVYFAKAKYPDAEAPGVAECPNGYYVDRMTLGPTKVLELRLLELNATTLGWRQTA